MVASSLEALAGEVQAFEAQKWPAYLETVEVQMEEQQRLFSCEVHYVAEMALHVTYNKSHKLGANIIIKYEKQSIFME